MLSLSSIFKKYSLLEYQVNSNSIATLLSVFYGILAVLLSNKLLHFMAKGDYQGIWLWPVSWLYWIDLAYLPASFVGLSLFTIGSLLLGAIFPHIRHIRIIAFLLTFLFLAAHFSFGKIDHSLHGFLFVCFWWMLIAAKEPSAKGKVWDKYCVFAAQLSVLGCYSLSGLWKLRKLTDAWIEAGWAGLDPVMTTLSILGIQSHYSRQLILDLDLSSDVSRMLWLLLILFEILCFLVAWFPGVQRGFGVVLILFHFIAAAAMDVHFFSMQILAVILFVAHPYQRRRIS